jgi:hypothetical protein
VRIEFTGLRPGEKLTEELLVDGERGVRSTPFSKIFVVPPVERDWSPLPEAVQKLEDAAQAGNAAAIHEIFRSLNIGYADPHLVSRGAADPHTAGFTVHADMLAVADLSVSGRKVVS